MEMLELAHLFTPLDLAAVVLLVAAWLSVTLLIEHPPRNRPSMSMLMQEFRREWMNEMVKREQRIFDSNILSNLRQGIAFFASAVMIALSGGLAIIGNAEVLAGVAEDLNVSDRSHVIYEIKLVLVILLLSNALLKFVWSHRLFGYCSVLVASTPNDPQDTRAARRAKQAAELSIAGARGFNRGLRSVYFALAAAAWLLGPLALIGATIITIAIILRREFASRSRSVMLGDLNN